MPVFTVEIPDVATTIHRQVIDSVVFNVLRQMGINKADVIYNSAYGNNAQPNATEGEQRDISFGASDKIVVEANEQRDDEALNDRGMGLDYQPPFFQNKFFKIVFAPDMARYTVETTITRRAASRAIVTNWANEMRRKFALGRSVIETEASFHYNIPTPCLNLLNALHSAMVAKIDDKFPLMDLLTNGFADAVTVIANQSGAYQEYAVRNTLTRILCLFDPSEEMEQEKSDNNSGAWTARFRFTFTYERPEAVTCFYPVILNNTLLPSEWWQEYEMPGIDDMRNTIRNVYIDAQDTISDTTPFARLPIFLPNCDTPIIPPMGRDPDEISLVAGYLELEPQEITPLIPLFSLTELGNVSFTPKVLQYLRETYQDNPDGSNSIVRVLVYQDGHKLDPDQIHVDAELRVWGNFTGEITSVYRFAITTRRNWCFLSDEGLEVIRRHPGFIYDWLKDFQPSLVDKYPQITESDTMDYPLLDRLADALSPNPDNTAAYYSDAAHDIIMLNVLNGRILTHQPGTH